MIRSTRLDILFDYVADDGTTLVGVTCSDRPPGDGDKRMGVSFVFRKKVDTSLPRRLGPSAGTLQRWEREGPQRKLGAGRSVLQLHPRS